MDNIFYIIIIALLVLLLAFSVVILLFLKRKNDTANSDELASKISKEIAAEQRELRQELSQTTMNSMQSMGEMISKSQSEKLALVENRINNFSIESEKKLDQIRQTVEQRLDYLQQDNNKQLEKMRKTVDQQLQENLESKLNKSFQLVSQRLEQVYKGLGEMQNLAVGVGDLKKVLSNVKTRGILGEIQLEGILTEILAPEQYDTNVKTKKGSKAVVEFAIKLPAKDEGFVYLPIDSKFPGDTYAKLRDAIDNGDKEAIEIAEKNLITTIKSEAKDIHDKYIDPPNTTEFAIMFLPFESLYSEVVSRGLVEILQKDYKVNIAGPSTMAALLNSLQMGFRTLAVQKRSTEVWKVLEEVKKEFDTFNVVLEKTQDKLTQANKELDKLVGVRTRQIQKKLSKVQTLGDSTETAIE